MPVEVQGAHGCSCLLVALPSIPSVVSSAAMFVSQTKRLRTIPSHRVIGLGQTSSPWAKGPPRAVCGFGQPSAPAESVGRHPVKPRPHPLKPAGRRYHTHPAGVGLAGRFARRTFPSTVYTPSTTLTVLADRLSRCGHSFLTLCLAGCRRSIGNLHLPASLVKNCTRPLPFVQPD